MFFGWAPTCFGADRCIVSYNEAGLSRLEVSKPIAERKVSGRFVLTEIFVRAVPVDARMPVLIPQAFEF